jgi:hypothetical protein
LPTPIDDSASRAAWTWAAVALKASAVVWAPNVIVNVPPVLPAPRVTVWTSSVPTSSARMVPAASVRLAWRLTFSTRGSSGPLIGSTRAALKVTMR